MRLFCVGIVRLLDVFPHKATRLMLALELGDCDLEALIRAKDEVREPFKISAHAPGNTSLLMRGTRVACAISWSID